METHALDVRHYFRYKKYSASQCAGHKTHPRFDSDGHSVV